MRLQYIGDKERNYSQRWDIKRHSLQFPRTQSEAFGLQFPVEIFKFALKVPPVGRWSPRGAGKSRGSLGRQGGRREDRRHIRHDLVLKQTAEEKIMEMSSIW